MKLNSAIVTGGAGFIGSHLVDALMRKGVTVTVVDNLSSGRVNNIKKWLSSPKFRFLQIDLLQLDNGKMLPKTDVIFHLAANAEVKLGADDPNIHYEQNIVATFKLLEAMRRIKQKFLVFASSSSVYGKPQVLPTPEDYGPLKPASVYGASKLAAEALISSYCETFGFEALVYRFANVVGARSRHGVIYDLIKKLKRNKNRLEILGDGNQMRSFMTVNDCVGAMLHGLNAPPKSMEIFNVGSVDKMSIKTVAQTIVDEMKLKNVQFVFSCKSKDGTGWKGDVQEAYLSIAKLISTGWRPHKNSLEAVKMAVKST
jgi:UDP-glucose 4-epimerase